MTEVKSERPTPLGDRIIPALVIGSALGLAVAVLTIFEWTPEDATLGFSQKIFYFHLPGAIFGYIGFGICGVASVLYLIRPSLTVDAVARAGASTGVVFCAMVLLTGPLWAKADWGAYWTGEPRLTLTLALFVIFMAYVLVRAYGGRTPLTRRVGAVLAIFGLADVPLVRYAVQRWGGNHPQVVTGGGDGLAPEMRMALWVAFAAFAMLFAALYWLRLRVGMAEEDLDTLHLEIGDRELLLEGEA